MRGADRAAGGVTCVRRIVNPVIAARHVLEAGEHVLLAGEAADAFAAGLGLTVADPDWFVTPARRAQLARAPGVTLDTDDPGTVGAVARDARGGLAAATSTGGMTRQAPGRVGDSPIVGAGTWADDATCAVSSTGEGERILRSALAHEVDARIRLGGQTLHEACRDALRRVQALHGRAGCIAVDAQGRFAMPFVTEGMARGFVRDDREPAVAIYGDEVAEDDEPA
jgi:beta-aspartyl-peptidase (threonine type)